MSDMTKTSLLFANVYFRRFFLFSAIFYGVAFSIKKEVFLQNPVNTPQKNGDPLIYYIKIKKTMNFIVHIF